MSSPIGSSSAVDRKEKTLVSQLCRSLSGGNGCELPSEAAVALGGMGISSTEFER
jgi:hypothetical protein